MAREIYTIYGKVVVTSASMSIAAPDNFSYIDTTVFNIERGQSLHITTERTIAEIKGNSNIPDKLVFSYGADNLTFEYTTLNGDGQIRKGSGGSYYYNYYLKDHLGSTRMVINDAGDITEAIMYQPYGTMVDVEEIATATDPAREKFTGKEFDRDGEDVGSGIAGMKLFYFGARYYDSDIGLWISCDPKNQYFSPYLYSGNNPISIVDPNGKEGVPAQYATSIYMQYKAASEKLWTQVPKLYTMAAKEINNIFNISTAVGMIASPDPVSKIGLGVVNTMSDFAGAGLDLSLYFMGEGSLIDVGESFGFAVLNLKAGSFIAERMGKAGIFTSGAREGQAFFKNAQGQFSSNSLGVKGYQLQGLESLMANYAQQEIDFNE